MGSTQDQVEVSYDVGNEFFRLWLDERMNYTSAVYLHPNETLEQAQLNKLRILSEYAHVQPGCSVIDIGCGWGANLEFMSLERKVGRAHGITLSTEQWTEITRRKIPNVTAEVRDYKEFKPAEKFDAATCICMMEHIASPEEARSGKHIDLYRDFFRRVHSWTKPGAYFGLQTILRNRMPRNKKDIEDIGHATYVIFPGGITERMEDIVIAVNPYWEVMEMKTRREDYGRTTGEWLKRLRDHKTEILAKWGQKVFDDYDRYLSTCVNAFDKHYQSLAQWSLRRID
ncbi:MAG: class I SAM-dependent methyltransferase [Deltaproteobacteria bacterium]|nr:class I SAM-dependent methyltransferase [Deltaproteobacteria bacterium]